MKSPSGKVALLFRYGAGEHVDFLPALPEILRRLHEEGLEVHHFGFRGKESLPADLRRWVQVHEGPFRVNRGSQWDKHLKALLWLMGLPFLGWRLQRRGFDKVFVDETLPLSAMLLRMGYRGKLLFTVHDFFMEIYWEPRSLLRAPARWIQRLDARAWRRLDRIFTRTESAKEFLTGKGLCPDRISVLPDPVNLQLFHPEGDRDQREAFRAAWGVTPQDLLMVHHGIMHPNKGNLRLIQAVQRLRERLPHLKLMLIGDGPEMPELRQTVTALGLQDRVLLTGWLPGLADISRALKAGDIGLVMRKGLPGDHFHVTSTLVHNLACGLPVLSARLRGISEVVEEGREGFLFDPVCDEEFDRKLIQLAESPELRKEMGLAARQKAEESFDPGRIAEEYVKWLCP